MAITKLLIEVGVSIWHGRNEYLHGKTILEQQQRAWEAVLRRVRDIYRSPPDLLRRFPRPADIPLVTRLQKGTRTLQAWTRVIEQQAAITQLERRRDRERFGTITRFFDRPALLDPG